MRRPRRRLRQGHGRGGDRPVEHRDRRGRPRRAPEVGGLLRRRAVPRDRSSRRRASSRSGDDLRLVGELTIKGITREVALEVEQLGQREGPVGQPARGVLGQDGHRPQGLRTGLEPGARDRRPGGRRTHQPRDRGRGRASGRGESGVAAASATQGSWMPLPTSVVKSAGPVALSWGDAGHRVWARHGVLPV